MQTTLASLRNVDIVLTPDKSLWSRCLVIESASRFYTQAGFAAQGGRFEFDLRAAPSVGKEAGANGLPLPDGDGEGMGWFPGYAIDVETGQRLNIFFGENAVYRDIDPGSGEIDFLADATFLEGRRGADAEVVRYKPVKALASVSSDCPGFFSKAIARKFQVRRTITERLDSQAL